MTHPRVLVALRGAGADAMSFTALEPDMAHWFDDEGAVATGACVSYVDTGRAWVAATGPLAAPADIEQVAGRFVRAAKAAGRRACFFGTEASHLEAFDELNLGQQPIFRPREWLAKLPAKKSLRAQLRRSSAKGVAVRHVDASELASGTALRRDVDQLARDWLSSRHMAPMGFLVGLELFVAPTEHLYFVAEVRGRVVALLSAVPIHARRGWLIEDIIRSRGAPNGTTELLFHAMMVHVADTCEIATLGLTPLSGDVPAALRLAGFLGRSFFDFGGLRSFRERLGPQEWQTVRLLYPTGTSPWLHVMDSLRAFAGGSLARFFTRSVLRHPGGPPWLLAIPLVPWTLSLVALSASGHAAWLGYRFEQLSGWSVFDALMIVLLFRVASRPTLLALTFAVGASLVDAALSVVHLRTAGLGSGVLEEVLRGVATAAPCVAVLLLLCACARAVLRGRARAVAQ